MADLTYSADAKSEQRQNTRIYKVRTQVASAAYIWLLLTIAHERGAELAKARKEHRNAMRSKQAASSKGRLMESTAPTTAEPTSHCPLSSSRASLDPRAQQQAMMHGKSTCLGIAPGKLVPPDQGIASLIALNEA
eukprot:338723-Pelagomonas_calceolata.AAC.3